MNIASVLKSDEKKYLPESMTGTATVWSDQKPMTSEITLFERPAPALTAQPETNDPDAKRLTQKLLWVDMISNALVVIAIASVSYFFISAGTVGPTLETVVAAEFETSQPQ
jgi:hypothetical protein